MASNLRPADLGSEGNVMLQRNNGPRHFEKKKTRTKWQRWRRWSKGVFKGRDIQGPRVTDRGSRDKSEDWQVEGNDEGASGHSHEPLLFARPCGNGHSARRAAVPQMLFHQKNTSTWNKPFQPPLRRLLARALIASRAFRFAFVDLFVDQDGSFFFCEWLKLPTVCKCHQRKAPTTRCAT